MLLAEQLVGVGRERRQRKMHRRERLVEGTSAVLFLAARSRSPSLVSTPRGGRSPADRRARARLRRRLARSLRVLGRLRLGRAARVHPDAGAASRRAARPAAGLRRRLPLGAARDRDRHVAPPARDPRGQRILVRGRARCWWSPRSPSGHGDRWTTGRSTSRRSPPRCVFDIGGALIREHFQHAHPARRVRPLLTRHGPGGRDPDAGRIRASALDGASGARRRCWPIGAAGVAAASVLPGPPASATRPRWS